MNNTMKIQPPVIQTERLTLKRYTPDDAESVATLAGAKQVYDTTLNIPYPYNNEDAIEWLKSHDKNFENGASVQLKIVSRENIIQHIGGIGLELNHEYDSAELGYWIAVPFWNNGYATEASLAMLQYGFETLKLNRIHAHHFANNPASGKVMIKIGMSYEGTLKQHIKKDGKYIDTCMYGILKSDYQNNKNK